MLSFWNARSNHVAVGTKRTCRGRLMMSAPVKVCGCRPHEGGAARTVGPAYANLQWRKPREVWKGCASDAMGIYSVQRNCFELALYTARDRDCISNRIGSGIRCAMQMSSRYVRCAPNAVDDRTDHHADRSSTSGPHRQVRRRHRSIHCWRGHAARRSALPRERFSPLTQCMVRPRVARGFRRSGRKRSCINVSGL
jgi:hypothetical protein